MPDGEPDRVERELERVRFSEEAGSEEQIRQKVPKEVLDLLNGGKYEELIENFSELPSGLQKIIIKRLVDIGQGQFVLDNLDKLESYGRKKVANIIIYAGQFDQFRMNLIRLFDDSDHRHMNQRANGVKWGKELIGEYLLKYKDLSHEQLVYKLMEIHKGRWALAANLDMFEGVDHEKIAFELIARGDGFEVALNLDLFEGGGSRGGFEIYQAGWVCRKDY